MIRENRGDPEKKKTQIQGELSTILLIWTTAV